MIKRSKIIPIGKNILIIISLFAFLTSSLYAANKERVRVDKKSIETFLAKYHNICENAKDNDETGLYDEKSIEDMAGLFEYDIDYADEVITACKNSLIAFKGSNIEGQVKVIDISYNELQDIYMITYEYLSEKAFIKKLVYIKNSDGKMSWFFVAT